MADPGPVLRGRRSECEALDRLVGERAGGAEPGAGPARRGGRRQDGAAGVPASSARRAAASRARRASSPRWSSRSPGCTSCARRCWTALDRLPGPQRDALATAFGLSTGEPPDRFLVGAGRAEPAGRGRRGAAAGLRRRRRAVARPGLGAGAGVRRAPPAGRAGRAGVRGARARATSSELAGLPELAVRGLGDGDARALLDSVHPRAGWTSGCATGSSPRRAATRSRCWSCRAG